MRGNTHAVAGGLVGLLVGQQLEPGAALVCAAVGAVGALLPDIDHPGSIVGRRAWIVGGTVRLFVSHRGALHSGLVAALLMLGALLTGQTVLLAGAAGWASHIALDMMTGAGVPLLWPRQGRWSLLPLRTGGIVEALLFIVLGALLLWLVYLEIK